MIVLSPSVSVWGFLNIAEVYSWKSCLASWLITAAVHVLNVFALSFVSFEDVFWLLLLLFNLVHTDGRSFHSLGTLQVRVVRSTTVVKLRKMVMVMLTCLIQLKIMMMLTCLIQLIIRLFFRDRSTVVSTPCWKTRCYCWWWWWRCWQLWWWGWWHSEMMRDTMIMKLQWWCWLWKCLNLKQRVEHSVLLNCIGMDTLQDKDDDCHQKAPPPSYPHHHHHPHHHDDLKPPWCCACLPY